MLERFGTLNPFIERFMNRSSNPDMSHAPPCILDYELIRCVGRGASGEVWLARNVMGTWRAVKVVRSHAGPAAEPLEREFTGLQRFEPISRTHPAYVNILHIGYNKSENLFYYVMELADDVASGDVIVPDRYRPRTLSAEIQMAGRLPLDICLRYIRGLADGLAHLHHHGLIHGDIKPANIIFVKGDAKLADIGLVTGIGEGSKVLGTQGYMPPEGAGTPSGDLYALGKVLYVLSSGRRVEEFPELPEEVTRGHASLQRFAELNEVILRACDPDPHQRYQTAFEFCAALAMLESTSRHENPSRDRSLGESVHEARSGFANERVSERKHVTLLFVDLYLPEDLDPEEADTIIQSGLKTIEGEIHAFEGTIAQRLNGGLMAVFGAPVAQEEHQPRAVYAALAVLKAFKKLGGISDGLERVVAQVRCALHSGSVMTHFNAMQGYWSVTGNPVSVASRLLAFAEPSQILLTDELWNAVKDFFFVESFDLSWGRGNAGSTRVHAVIGAHRVGTRMEYGRTRELTPYVGRETELARIRELWNAAESGQGQVVMIVGEPGAGKSRFLHEFRRVLGEEMAVWRVTRSVAFGKQLPYFPLVGMVEQILEIDRNSHPEDLLSEIHGKVSDLRIESESAIPILLRLLDVNPPTEEPLDMDARQQRILTFELLRNLLLAASERKPLIVVIEDLHWVDKVTEDFLSRFVTQLSKSRVLLCLSYRNSFIDPFPTLPHITRISMEPLSVVESIRLAEGMISNRAIPKEIQQIIHERAEGNPFFVEEIMRSLMETGVIRTKENAVVVPETLKTPAIPGSIHDVIMGRVDRLPPHAKRALQLASVIGREFGVHLLETLVDTGEPLGDALRLLVHADLIFERKQSDTPSYLFKHALTQDAAYQSLPQQRRKDLHRLVAASSEELFADRLPEHFGTLAYHYERGEEWERALDYLEKAAERSHRMGARREQAEILGRAIVIADRLQNKEQAGSLRLQRGKALVEIAAWEEARNELESALEVLPEGDGEKRAEALTKLAWSSIWLFDRPKSIEYANQALPLANRSGRSDLAVDAMGSSALIKMADCRHVEARELYMQALGRAGDTIPESLSYAPHASYALGHYDEGIRVARQAAASYRNHNQTMGLLIALSHLGLNLAAKGAYNEAGQVFDEAKKFGKQYEIWPLLARCISMSSAYRLDLFDYAGAKQRVEEALELACSSNFRSAIMSCRIDLLYNALRQSDFGYAAEHIEVVSHEVKSMPGWHTWIWDIRIAQARAELALGRGQWREAITLAEHVLSESASGGRVKYEALALWTRAQAFQKSGDSVRAIADLRRALAIAVRTGEPAMLIRLGSTLLQIEGDDTLAAALRSTIQSAMANMSEASLRDGFLNADPIRRIGISMPH